jgi:hypothetical protein
MAGFCNCRKTVDDRGPAGDKIILYLKIIIVMIINNDGEFWRAQGIKMITGVGDTIKGELSVAKFF